MTSLIGTSPPRPDGVSKASGTARYADDYAVPGMMWGATVRSPHAHARIAALTFRPELAPPGAVCVTARELGPGPNGVLLHDDAWPILAEGEVRHVGEAVALVAAPSKEHARRAAAAVEVAYEPLPAVLSLEDAARQEPLAELLLASGDVPAALATVPLIVEGEYATGHQEHIYIEPQAVTAWWDADGSLAVLGSMQCPYYVHRSLAHALGLAGDRVRVIASAVGGGFGGKEDYPSLIALHAAVLARAAERPVRLVYDRHEDIVATPKRHPALIRCRAGADRDGRLQALDIDALFDGGAYTTLSKVVLSRAVLHATGPYRCPNVRIRARALRTHTVPNGAFRGFGAPQVQFAAERRMDALARAAGLDPLEVRLRNCLEPGDRLPTGQRLDESAGARVCLEQAAERTGFRERWRALEEQRDRRGAPGAADADGPAPLAGIGISLYFHGAGFTGNGERRMRSPVTVRLAQDGRVEVLTAMTDMGQGVAAVFPLIAREAGGLGAGDLVFADPDTAVVPDSGPTAASRTTMVIGGTLALAVVELEHRLLAWWRESEGITAELAVVEGEVRAGDGRRWTFRDVARRHLAMAGPLAVTRRHQPPPGEFDEEGYQGDAYPTYAWGADVAEVEVDPDTLAVRPTRLTVVCEVGRVLHPVLAAGQIEGGSLQAVSWALLEELKLDGGRILNDRLATYLVPTFLDSPRIDVLMLERPWEGGPFGAKGIGELPMDGGAPAVAAAVECATGVAVPAVPATPERLLAWRRQGTLIR